MAPRRPPALRCGEMAQAWPIALNDLQPGDELLQSALWGRFKQRFGWRPEPVSWQAAGSGGTLLALTRPTPFGPLARVSKLVG